MSKDDNYLDNNKSEKTDKDIEAIPTDFPDGLSNLSPEELKQLIHEKADNPDEARKIISELIATTQTLQILETYEGPIPPAKVMKDYQEIDITFPDRILKMAERQIDHRISMENKMISANINAETRGSWFGFVIAIMFIIIGGYLVSLDRDIAGYIMLGGSAVTLAGSFLWNKHYESKDLTKDDKDNKNNEIQKKEE